MIKELLKERGVVLGRYSNETASKFIHAMGSKDTAEKYAGFCVRFRGRYYTFYDDTLPPEQVELILAHELGHIIMGHLTDKPGLSGEQCERDADMFGVMMLALSVYDNYKKRKENNHAIEESE